MHTRRILSLLAAAAVLVLTCCATCLAQGYPTEEQLLVNPGFDEDADENGVPDRWSTTPMNVKRGTASKG